MQKQKFRRRQIIVDRNLQFRFVFSIMLIMVILFAILGTLLIFGSSAEMAGSIYRKLAQIKNTKELYMGMTVRFSFLVLLVGFIIISIRFLIFSHRIVGPLYRFRQSLVKLGEGDLTLKVHFREKDELKDIAQLFTDTVSRLNGKVRIIRKETKNMAQVLSRRKLSATDLEKLSEANRRITEILSQLKT